MGKYITSFALLGALLIAAPALAYPYGYDYGSYDYEMYLNWRKEQGAVYEETEHWEWWESEGYEMGYIAGYREIPLLGIVKAGESGRIDGSIGWVHNPLYMQPKALSNILSVENNYQGDPNRYWLNFDSFDSTRYVEFGIALTGNLGTPGIFGGQLAAMGIMAYLSFEIDGSWHTLASLMYDGLGDDLQRQSYHNGEKVNSWSLNPEYDSMVTFLYSDLFGELIRQNGGIGIKIDPWMRNGFSLTVIGIYSEAPVPEPATLAVVGLGLAGLGLARRRKK